MYYRAGKVTVVAIVLLCIARSGLDAEETPHPLHYINTAFENASPLWWEVDAEGVIHVHLVYDHEREAPNRANGHWNFRIEAEPGANLTIMLGPFANIYNGRLGTAVREPVTTFVSDDGQQWRAVKMEYVEPDRRCLKVQMQGPSLYVARLQPYRISDLEKLKTDIAGKAMIARGQSPDLAIDFHNDASGKLHFPRSETNDAQSEGYLKSLKHFEEILRANSFFTEGSSTGISRTIAGGLQKRYGIPACIHELNADWIAGLDDYPTADNWKKYGEQLSIVFREYFQE